jgi:4-amino-4-deoxy-L-arabinose transferase-like glycosyltransferase
VRVTCRHTRKWLLSRHRNEARSRGTSTSSALPRTSSFSMRWVTRLARSSTRPRFGADSDGVLATMKSVRVVAQGSDRTWYGFYRGFGVFVSIFFAFSVFAAWRIGGATEQDRRSLLPIGWALFVSHAAAAIVAVAYFFPVPVALSTVVTALLGIGCVELENENRASKATRGVRVTSLRSPGPAGDQASSIRRRSSVARGRGRATSR